MDVERGEELDSQGNQASIGTGQPWRFFSFNSLLTVLGCDQLHIEWMFHKKGFSHVVLFPSYGHLGNH